MDYKSHFFGIILIAGLIIAAPDILTAQNDTDSTATSLSELLRDNRYPISIKNGELKGEGGKWLRNKATEASVITLGETHASQEIPALVQALIKDLQKADAFDYLAIEVSPWTTRQMVNRLNKGTNAYDQFIKKYSAAIPFYNFKTERNLLHQVVQNSEHEQPLWGLDQIFALSTNLVLDRLEALAPTDSVQAKISGIRAAGSQKVADDPRLQQLPDGIPPPISVYEPATFDSLKVNFAGIEEAQQILAELVKSIEIYRMNDQNNYVSNQLRARYLRDNLRKRFETVTTDNENPRLMIKVGARHAYRGLTPNNALDVGNLAVSMARSMGGEALNVAVICGPGSKNLSFPARTTDCWPDYLGKELTALSEEQPVLFDFTAIHPVLHEADIEISDRLEDFIWGLDAVVIIPNSQPAELIAPPTNSK